MPDDHFNYDQLMLDAHRELIRQVLLKVEQTGLPGEHHFFIIFNTTHKGARISDRLRAQYPSEMTIVVQHQYSNLKIYKDRFEIQLSFNRIPELLVVPFSAITGFVDPSVPFGLQLASEPPTGLENSIGMLVPGLPQISPEDEASKESAKKPEQETADTDEYLVDDFDNSNEDLTAFWEGADTSVPTIFPAKNKMRDVSEDETDKPQSAVKLADVEEDDENEDEEEEAVNANIVQLDAFRKKSK